MKNLSSFLILLIAGLLIGCSSDDSRDREKIVEMTIYPEIGYGSPVMSDVIYEQMVFSESDDTTKRLLTDIITEGFDFDYEIGNEYNFKANKIWMSDPPQDVSSIKYEFVGPVTKKNVLKEDSEEELTLIVKPDLVKFSPVISGSAGSDEPEVFDAMNCINQEDEKIIIIKEIDGFDFEEGYDYELEVKQKITAEPYSVEYTLRNINNKEKA